MLVINKPIKIKQFIVLVIILMLPFLVKIMVKPINAGVYFSGFSQLIYNIFIGCIKLLLGFLGAIFEIKVTDTLYILNPAFPTPLTIIAILFLLITTFTLLNL